MTTTDEPTKALKITALSVADAAKALSTAYGRRVTEEQVRQVAEAGDLLRGDSVRGYTVNLLEYVAFLVREIANGSD